VRCIRRDERCGSPRLPSRSVACYGSKARAGTERVRAGAIPHGRREAELGTVHRAIAKAIEAEMATEAEAIPTTGAGRGQPRRNGESRCAGEGGRRKRFRPTLKRASADTRQRCREVRDDKPGATIAVIPHGIRRERPDDASDRDARLGESQAPWRSTERRESTVET